MVIRQDFYYPPNDGNRQLHIWLPDEYETSGERYPVMYMFDGHNLFYDDCATFGRAWRFASFTERWEKKMIIVGMECSHEGNQRLSEYSPYDKRWQRERIPGIGEQTFQWIIHSVKPWIDSHLRTYGHREATAIGGSSMGGLMSIYGVIRHNDVFSKAACVSPGIFWNLSSLRRDLYSVSLHPDTRIYMSWGEIEAGRAAHHGNPAFDTREARSVRKFEKELQSCGVNTYLFFQHGGRHCEEDWEKQIPVFMHYLWF